MAKLFKDKRIKQALEGLEIPNFDEKLNIVKRWHEAYESKRLHEKTETQCEQAFNQDFFVEVLEYTTFPEKNYSLDPKASTEASGQKPDAILGSFGDVKRVIAVVEIKDVNTPLDKAQQRTGNLSPIQQGFKYKPQYKGCDFVIVTNFFETRLFKDNQLDYESFTLTDLVNPEDDYFQFRKFYYLLCKQNFAPQAGESTTEKLLSVIRVEQEKITKKFYTDYKELRRLLIKNIVKNNDIPKQEFASRVIEKAQKIIDRIVFISFCEDLNLLPEDKLLEVVHHTEKLGLSIPIWDIMKSFFNAIDVGSEKMGIPDGYNGELFKPDLELEQLKIDDEICKKFVEIGKYDFSEDLTVNILGHIFEQSISDIEELKRIKDPEEADKKVSKRKKDGIFYTPDYIVEYIVKNSLGTYLQEKEQKIKEINGLKEEIKDKMYDKRLLLAYEKYQQELQSIKVLDPACGSGAFLVKVFDYLLEENKRVANIISDLEGGTTSIFNTEAYFKEILQNNIYGVDLNEESVEITKLSLWLKTAQKGRKLTNLNQNIKCGNSLIDDPEVAGDKAFDWNKEFSHIMDNGGFDVVVGNPPYVLCQPSNTEESFLNFYKSTFKSASYKIDLFHLFIEKSINLLKSHGIMGFITPNTYMTNKYIQKLREFILINSNVKDLVVFDKEVFVDASVDVSIIITQKTKSKSNIIRISKMDTNGELQLSNNIPQKFWDKEKNMTFNVNLTEDSELDNTVRLGDICSVTFGLQTKNKKIYVSKKKEGTEWEECYTGKDITRYSLHEPRLYFKNNPSEVKAGGSWDMKKHHSKKIVVRQVGGPEPIFAYDERAKACLNTMYNIILLTDDFHPKYILGVLNSTFVKHYWNSHFSDNKKTFPKIKGFQLQELPIPNADSKTQLKIARWVDEVIRLYGEIEELYEKFLFMLNEICKQTKEPANIKKLLGLDPSELIKKLKVKKLNVKEQIFEISKKYRDKATLKEAEINKIESDIDRNIQNLYEQSNSNR